MDIKKDLILEFGVGAGNSINYFASELSKHNSNIYGFGQKWLFVDEGCLSSEKSRPGACGKTVQL